MYLRLTSNSYALSMFYYKNIHIGRRYAYELDKLIELIFAPFLVQADSMEQADSTGNYQLHMLVQVTMLVSIKE
jgi:hypothetical protein